METQPIERHIGTQITGFQLAQASDADIERLQQLVSDRGVVVLRDQDLSPDAHIRFAQRWGGIDINDYFPLAADYPEIAVVRKRADQQTNIGGAWHTDHSYDQIPAMGSILVARVLPPAGGDTLFAHMGAAYDSLADDLKDEIAGLKAFHSADHVYQEGACMRKPTWPAICAGRTSARARCTRL